MGGVGPAGCAKAVAAVDRFLNQGVFAHTPPSPSVSLVAGTPCRVRLRPGLVHIFDRNGEQVAEVALEQAGACISIEWDKDGEVRKRFSFDCPSSTLRQRAVMVRRALAETGVM